MIRHISRSVTLRLHHWFKRLVALTGLPLLLCLAVEAAPPELQTQGNQIVVKSTGAPIRLVGVNIPSLGWGNGEYLSESVDAAYWEWRANIIRLPISQSHWLGPNQVTYREIVDDVIQQISDYSMYVIFDLHEFHKPTNTNLTFWLDAADRYKNNPAVLFGLFNEPNNLGGWDAWLNGTTNQPGMQDLLDTVRSTGANNIVLVGGSDYAYDLSGVFDGYVLTDTTNGNGVVYDAHLYPLKSYWQSRVGNIGQEHPILLGEIGHPGGTSFLGYSIDDEFSWVPQAMDWVNSHNFHWTAWSLHPTASPNMINSWDFTPTSFWGAAAIAHMHANSNPSAERVIGGTVIGTTGTRTEPLSGVLTDWKYGAVTPFNGGFSTYFDGATADGAWTGLDLITPQRITRIEYMPRKAYGSRMVGGVFEASNTADFSSDVTTLYTITNSPDDSGLIYTSAIINNTNTFRYIRYVGPDGAYCNVSALLFYTGDGIADTSAGEDVIVDNADGSGLHTVGTWLSSTGTSGYNASNYWHDNNSYKGQKSVRFTPNLASYGDYEVFARWTASANRASNVPVDIIHGHGTAFDQIDQKINGGDWISLGVFPFGAGTSASLLMGNTNTDGYVVADAVRFVKITDDIIIDNSNAYGLHAVGNWRISSGSGYNGYARHDENTDKGNKSMRFTPDISIADDYEVFLRWTAHPNRASNVPVDIISSQTGTTTVTINQQQNGDIWHSLGTYPLGTGTDNSVLIRTNNTNGYVIADAVRFIRDTATEYIIDNTESTYVTLNGSWSSSTSTSGYFGSNYLHDNNSGKGSKSVQFTPNLAKAATYEVFARWTAYTNRASNVPVDINYNGGNTTVTIDQKQDHNQWISLGSYSFSTGTAGTITFRNDGTNGYVIVDAVRLVEQ